MKSNNRNIRSAHAHSRRAGRGAFTLIELLLVVAILMVLAMILVPALGRAIQLARDAMCVTHLRSIGQAWQFYLNDSNDFFPLWQNNLQWFYGGKHPSIANETHSAPAMEYRPLNPYVTLALRETGRADLFKCASDRDIRDPAGQEAITQGHTTYDYFGNSYPMNWLLLMRVTPRTGIVAYGKPYSRKQVEVQPSKLVLAGDCQWYYTVCDAQWDANFHNDEEKMGLVFLDGHAAFLHVVRGDAVTADYTFLPYETSGN